MAPSAGLALGGRGALPISKPLMRAEGDDFMSKRITAFVYGVLCYISFFATFLYAIGFLGNFLVPKSIDSGRELPITLALAINTVLLGVFALQHSVMARQWFKRAWTRLVPAPVERSTYVLFSSVALLLLFWKWQPMGGLIWRVDSAVVRAVIYGSYALGWITVLVTTFLINHFDLFGLRQVWLYLRGVSYTPLKFRTPGPYRVVRHPLYVGWLLVFWSAPVMTMAHLIFALATTGYILIAIQFEERDLVQAHPEYEIYRRRVPMILPFGSSKQPSGVAVSRKQTSELKADRVA
jgi:methanethiol S-methyltransferase